MPVGEPWEPGKFAVWHQRWGEFNDASPTAVILRHPTAPFVRTITDDNERTLQTLASDYVIQAHDSADISLTLPSRWIKALKESDDPTFWWLPIRWPEAAAHGNPEDPFVSYEVRRRPPNAPADAPPIDRTVVLLASEWFSFKPFPIYIGSEFGIRVIVHLRKLPEASNLEARITGMSASLPFGRFLTHGYSTSPSSGDPFRITAGRVLGNQSVIKAAIEKLLGLKNVYFRGVRVAELAEFVESKADLHVEWRCTSNPEPGAGRRNSTSYALVFRGTNLEAGNLINKAELVADAVEPGPGDARLFPIDPASHRRATDSHLGATEIYPHSVAPSSNDLDRELEWEKITNGAREPLKYPLSSSDSVMESTDSVMEIMTCPGFVPEDHPSSSSGVTSSNSHHDAKEVYLPGAAGIPPIRSNDFAAISAYYNVRHFFERLEAYGIAAKDYFRMANLPLRVFYRSGIPPGRGKDGQTVNARVRVEGWPEDLVAPEPKGRKQRPLIEMHLALANLSTRARNQWDGQECSPAEPLGIAADARWIWHEIGHVLLMASVGELVFRFCHSPGDALAAIASDPRSRLATDASWRGATFPWVFTPRRHDRCVAHGWSWGGTMHDDMAQVPMSQAPRTKGYRTEQILSSSLFRLYRCIGGDTINPVTAEPDRSARESASHYATYLIMRGIQQLGPSDVVPAYQPDQLVSALIEADVGTERWDVGPPPDALSAPPLKLNRVGGCVHKVIRWAFEVQGLYNDFGKVTNGPGNPPPVDVYIESNRPSSDGLDCGVDYGPGSYAPVSLDWNPGQRPSEVPSWQAKPEAIVVRGNEIYVKVGNRGSQDATDVKVYVWWHEWHDDNSPPPPWKQDGAGWTMCGPQNGHIRGVPNGATIEFGPFTHAPPPGRRYIVLAQATCKDDRANIDRDAYLPCGRLQTNLVDLVANDNNLGLRVIHP